MKMSFTHRQNKLSEAPKDAPQASFQSYIYGTDSRSRGDMHVNHSLRGDQTLYQRPYDCIPCSPISSLSPPLSTSSSDPYQGLDYQYDSENSSCSQLTIESNAYARSVYSQASQGAAALICNGSPDSSSPVQFYMVNSSFQSTGFNRTLVELETTLMGPDGEDVELLDLDGQVSASWEKLLHTPSMVVANAPRIENLRISESRSECQQQTMQSMERMKAFLPQQAVSQGSHTKSLLLMCAASIAENQLDRAAAIMHALRKEVSVYGSPLERLAAYMSEGLVAKLQASGSAIYRALKCGEASGVDLLPAMQKLYEICPYFKFAYAAANGAIAEAFKDEANVHIFDLQIAQGTQWFSLIQALGQRPGGPPHIRITTVDDPTSHTSPIGGMQFVKGRLGKLAESLCIPFEFHVISCQLSELQGHMIERRPNEALAVNFALQLHHMPDESVCVTNPRDCLIRLAKGLEPKVVTLVEQEANTNTAPFLARFVETLDYYSAVFESIDVALPRNSKDRVNVEEQCLARDIVNVIACEGAERVERHELTAKWHARMTMAGFRPHPLSTYVNDIITGLLKAYSENYTLKQEGGALYLGWLNRALVVASAWKVHKA